MKDEVVWLDVMEAGFMLDLYTLVFKSLHTHAFPYVFTSF